MATKCVVLNSYIFLPYRVRSPRAVSLSILPGVNFTNILQAGFCQFPFTKKITNRKCKYRDALKLYKKLHARKMLVRWLLVLISPTFQIRKQILHWFPFAKKLQTQIVSTEMLQKKFFMKKLPCKMLMKLDPDVNFTNILRAAFSYKSVLRSFSVLTVWVFNFLAEGNQCKSWS